MSPLDLERLAVRIERLKQTNTHDWSPADQMEFWSGLPDGNWDDVTRRLPDPKALRAAATRIRAGQDAQFSHEKYRVSIQRCFRLESLVANNRPHKRMMRDMIRGRLPFGRR